MPQPHAPPSPPQTTAFRVVFYDGGRQTHLRNIILHPDLTFKQFQIKLSQITGISYNNLTTYLVANNIPSPSPLTSPELNRRRILITSKVNFAVIVKQTHCYFFVVLKRSRRDRRRRHSFAGKHDVISVLNSAFDDNIAGKHDVMNVSVKSAFDDDDIAGKHDVMNVIVKSAFDDDDIAGKHDVMNVIVKSAFDDEYNKFCYGYDVNKCCYMNVIVNAAYGSEFDSPFSVNFPKIEDVYGPRVSVPVNRKVKMNRRLCEECTAAVKENRTPEFHHCVYDEVVVGRFRSPAGPICRRRRVRV